jgi:hypothetical protein
MQEKWTGARPFLSATNESKGLTIGAAGHILFGHFNHLTHHVPPNCSALAGGNLSPVAIFNALQTQFVSHFVLELVQGSLSAGYQRTVSGSASSCHCFHLLVRVVLLV